MWNYEKRLQYPVKITQTNPKLAQVIISQFGGPDGELAASMRYLSQRYTMPYREVTGTLTDIGTEELAHMEMILPSSTSSRKTCPQRRSSGPDLTNTMWIIRWPCGLSPPAACPGAPRCSSPRGIPSRICTRTWRQSRRQGPPTTTFSGL